MGIKTIKFKDSIGEALQTTMVNGMTRSQILDKAKEIVNGHREEEYGSPEDNFKLIAMLWTSYLGYDVLAKDVAAMMILLKIARAKTGAGTEDCYIDIAGYAACGGEIESKQRGC